MNITAVFKSLLGLCLIAALGSAFGSEVTVRVGHVKVEKTLSRAGDELYFNLTQHTNNGRPSEQRVPVYPAHWLSRQMNKVKNVIVWQGALKEGDSVKLVLSLMEQSLPHFEEMDRLIGSAELTLAQNSGQIKHSFGIPGSEKESRVEMKKSAKGQAYIFKGDGSRYDVTFWVEIK